MSSNRFTDFQEACMSPPHQGMVFACRQARNNGACITGIEQNFHLQLQIFGKTQFYRAYWRIKLFEICFEMYTLCTRYLDLYLSEMTQFMSSSNEVSGSAQFKIMELPVVRRTQPITIGQNFFNNLCPIATMATCQKTTT